MLAPMDRLDRLGAALGRRRRLERALARLLPGLGVAGLAGATVVAVVRIAWPEASFLVPALAATAILAPLALLPWALRHRDPPWLLAAHLDRLAAGDGLVMALAGAGARDPGWAGALAGRLAQVRLPRLRAPGLPGAAAGLLLLAGALLLPQAAVPPPPPPLGTASLERTRTSLAALDERGLAPPAEVAALAERLAAVGAAMRAEGLSQQTWAAIDALDRDVAAAHQRAADALAAVLAAAEPLAAGDAASQPGAVAELAAALAGLARQAPGIAELPGGLQHELAGLALQALAGGELTDAERQALERLGAGGGRDAAPPDPAAAQALAERLAAELAQRAGRLAGACKDGLPGPDGGGPGPGGGHADLLWGDFSRIAGGYRDGLGAGSGGGGAAGPVLATRSRAPGEDEQGGEAPAAGAEAATHATAPADGRAARIAPRHRAAVAGYFAAATPPAAAPRPLP